MRNVPLPTLSNSTVNDLLSIVLIRCNLHLLSGDILSMELIGYQKSGTKRYLAVGFSEQSGMVSKRRTDLIKTRLISGGIESHWMFCNRRWDGSYCQGTTLKSVWEDLNYQTISAFLQQLWSRERSNWRWTCKHSKYILSETILVLIVRTSVRKSSPMPSQSTKME